MDDFIKEVKKEIRESVNETVDREILKAFGIEDHDKSKEMRIDFEPELKDVFCKAVRVFMCNPADKKRLEEIGVPPNMKIIYKGYVAPGTVYEETNDKLKRALLESAGML